MDALAAYASDSSSSDSSSSVAKNYCETESLVRWKTDYIAAAIKGKKQEDPNIFLPDGVVSNYAKYLEDTKILQVSAALRKPKESEKFGPSEHIRSLLGQGKLEEGS